MSNLTTAPNSGLRHDFRSQPLGFIQSFFADTRAFIDVILRNLSTSEGLNPIGGDENVRDMLDYQQGNDAAFLKIYHRNKKKIYSWAFRMLRNEHSAEEISQEVFLRISRARDSYKPDAKFTTWIYTITTRLVFNEIRRKKRHPEKEIEMDEWQNVPDLSDQWMSQLETGEQKKMLEDCLEKVPERQRAALLLRYVEGLSHEEISEALGFSPKAIKSLLHRGLVSLTEIMQKEGVTA